VGNCVVLVKACKDPSGVAMVTENSGKNIIFSRSGKEVRECCITSGKISILPQLREKSGRFSFLLATKFDKDFFIVGKVMLFQQIFEPIFCGFTAKGFAMHGQ